MVPASEWQPMGIHLCRSLSPEAVSVFPVVFALFGIEFYRPFISVWPFRGWQYRYLERLGVLAEVTSPDVVYEGFSDRGYLSS